MKRKLLISIFFVILISIILLLIDFHLIFILPIGFFVFAVWFFGKGKWEKNIKKEEARKWKKSVTFNIYLALLILNLILELFLLVNPPPSISNDPANYLNTLSDINFGFVTGINLIFIVFSLWKKLPKQILSLSLISFIVAFIIPQILIAIGLFGTPVFSLIFILLPIAQIIWALYVRFIFLNIR